MKESSHHVMLNYSGNANKQTNLLLPQLYIVREEWTKLGLYRQRPKLGSEDINYTEKWHLMVLSLFGGFFHALFKVLKLSTWDLVVSSGEVADCNYLETPILTLPYNACS